MSERVEEQAPRKFEQVYECIREDIVALRLAPGTMIYENELAERMQVSRTPIREAIRLLVSEQLLDVLPQRGTKVARISERQVREARFVREQLEWGGFRMAARLWDPERHAAEAGAIEGLLARQADAAAAGDGALFFQLDEAFHRNVLELTGNTTLIRIIYQMRGHLNRLRILSISRYQPMERLTEEHRALFGAIRGNDEEETGRLLLGHIGRIDKELPELRMAYPDYFQD